MAKAELGMKLTCESCETRFYDLNKTPGICPKCGASNARPVIFKASRRTPEAVEVKKPEPPKPKDDIDDDDDNDSDVIEDTSDLGDDDVDVVVKKDDDDN